MATFQLNAPHLNTRKRRRRRWHRVALLLCAKVHKSNFQSYLRRTDFVTVINTTTTAARLHLCRLCDTFFKSQTKLIEKSFSECTLHCCRWVCVSACACAVYTVHRKYWAPTPPIPSINQGALVIWLVERMNPQ